MPQETNLNVAPYFDDFDKEDDYYKVLFKPGYPVQARELTTIQSISQNQIEQFANYFFKEGTAVSGGQVNYIQNYPCIMVEDSFNGRSIIEYAPNLVDDIVVGSKSGVRAKIEAYLPRTASERGYDTFYISYLSSNSTSSQFTGFIPGEEILIENEFQSTSSLSFEENDDPEESLVESLDNLLTFQPGSPLLKCIETNPNAVGSAVIVNDGVYYIRGYFVPVSEKTLLLDQYSTRPSFKVGFFISESIETYIDNEDLLDNAQGFPNFSAPGADRLSIDVELVKIDLNDSTDLSNFIQIFEVRSGILQNKNRTNEYTNLQQEFARKTFDQSGDFYVRPPTISIRNSLNDRKGNDGLFNEGELTPLGQTPSDNLGSYKISPIKAYVKGFEIETIASTILDFEKPRSTKKLENQTVTYFTGPTFVINRVYGYPTLGISTNFYVSLRDERVGTSQTTSSGKEIGVARVFDYELETGSYNVSNSNLNEWDIALYDVQPYVELTINEPITLSTPISIKGKSSGATAHLRYSTTNSGILTAYNVSGRFSVGEKLFFNGIENPRVTRQVKEYSTSDVKSVYGINSNGTYFSADTKQYTTSSIGQVNITPESAGICTVTSTTVDFSKIFSVNDLCAYTNPSNSTITYSKVTQVSVQTINISGITTVTGINEGSLPQVEINPSDFSKISTRFQRSTDNTLYTTLPKKYISSVDLIDSTLIVRKTYNTTITDGSTNTISSGTDLRFLTFDEGRYILTRDDGTIEPLSSDKFVFANNFTQVTIIGLGTNTTGTLVATLEKTNVTSKSKVRNKVKSIIVDKSRLVGSGTGTTTLNDGLTYGNYPYGTRVQDEEISLNYPDVTKILGIYESNDLLEPDFRKLTLSNFTGQSSSTADFIIGEEIVGDKSGAVAIVVEKNSSSIISFIYLNTATFQANEFIESKESQISANIDSISGSDLDITSNYTLDSGYKNTLYDYSRIIRKSGVNPPSKKIKIVFEYASYADSDNGDITTINSYSSYDYCDIPKIDGISCSDIIDIRPIVDPYNVVEGSYSPFEFFGRSFDGQKNSSEHILASDELITINYSYYLPRIDRIFLDKTGQFHLVKGTPAENPTIPANKDDAIEIATISLPAYLCDISLANVKLAEYKRYQMQDIKKLEDRIKNLEYYTSLSLLESDTSNLFISDSNGLNRFKSGFFVDNFESAATQLKVTEVKNSVDPKNGELRASPYTTSVDLLLGTFSSLGIGTDITSPINLDAKYDGNIIGENIVRTGNVITLDYEEFVEISQGYATEVIPVSSYSSVYYSGTIDLTPSSDVWLDQVRLEPNVIDTLGKHTKTSIQLSKEQFNQQSGFGPVFWNAWETTWTGAAKIPAGTKDVLQGYDIVRETLFASKKTGTSVKQGFAEKEIESFNKVSQGDSVVSIDFIKTMRSRNIEFTAKSLKPFTRVYPFFDNVSVSQFCVPKLLEIEMISGSFQIGEIVKTLNSKVKSAGNGAVVSGVENPYIQFRLSAPNHKEGLFNAPIRTYTTNPYNNSSLIPDSYSSTSTILNVDTYSLANQPQGDYYGYVTVGMELVGSTSGAKARVTDIRLITDIFGYLAGSFYIPNANVPSNPKFETGTKIFRLSSEQNNNTSVPGLLPSCGAEEPFYAEGTINTVQENILSVRNVQTVTASIIESRPEVFVGEPTVSSSTIVGNIKPPPPPPDEPEPDPVVIYVEVPTPTPPPFIDEEINDGDGDGDGDGDDGGDDPDQIITTSTPRPQDPGPITIGPTTPTPTTPTTPRRPRRVKPKIPRERAKVRPKVKPGGRRTRRRREKDDLAKVKFVFDKKGNALPIPYVPFTIRRGKNKGQVKQLNFNRIKEQSGRKAAKKAFKEAGVPLPPKNTPGRGLPARPPGDKKSTRTAVVQLPNGNIKVVDTSKKAREAKRQEGKSNVKDIIKPGDKDYGFYNKGKDVLKKFGATMIVTQNPKATKRVTKVGGKKFEEKGFPIGKLPLVNGPIQKQFPDPPPPVKPARPKAKSKPVPSANQNRSIGAGFPVRPAAKSQPKQPARPQRPSSPRPAASPPPPPTPTVAPRPTVATARRAPSRASRRSGGRGGRRSDLNLKTDLIIISNALNKLMNL